MGKIKIHVNLTENKSPSALCISTKIFSFYSTKLSVPSGMKERLVLSSFLPGYSVLPQWSLVFTLCYDSSIRWLRNWNTFCLPHMCLLGVVLCNGHREFLPVPSSSRLEIFTEAAQCHRKIQVLQPFIWVFPDLPFKLSSSRKARI